MADMRAPQPAGPPMDYADMRMMRFRELAGRFEIRPDFAAKLRQLEGYEIVLLCDDSGSMSTPMQAVPSGDPFKRATTRWDELKHYVSIVTDIAAVLDSSGIDVYFLNRPPLHNIATAAQVEVAFQHPPGGFTPLSRAIRQILADKAAVIAEKRLLLIIATDGQPTDDSGNVNLQDFFGVLKGRPRNVFVSVIACTDDLSSVEYLNRLDSEVAGVDTCDDYASERAEIQRARGPRYAFSFGDYVVKTLLGSIDSSFDKLDEGAPSGGGGGCCTIC